MNTFEQLFLVVFLLFVSSSARTIDYVSYENLKDTFVGKAAASQEGQFTDRSVKLGAGYSRDSQQVTEQKCFRASISSISNKKGEVKLDEAVSFSDLENILKFQVSAGGQFPMFSTNAKANYMRSIQDKDYSLSLNYYSSFSHKVTVNIEDYGVQALTNFGKGTYNDSSNRYFGLVCGDHYIASYDEGALLTMGLNIKLNSREQKNKFTTKAKINYGAFNIMKAAGDIERISNENKMSGSVTLHAFQLGGNPTQLTDLLNGNILTCKFSQMEPCMQTAKKLIDYAKDFGQQIQNNSGFEPLGTASYHPVEWIGLTPPPSLVTKEVSQHRQELAKILKNFEYYKEKLYSVQKGYPAELDGAFFDNANLILSKADSNIRILMNPESGAAGCFNDPDRCKEIKDDIKSRLQNISEHDLKFLNRMKYIIPIPPSGDFYNTGGEYENSWKFVLRNPENNVSVDSVYITNEVFEYALALDPTGGVRIIYRGVWDPNQNGYVGNQTLIVVDKNSTTKITHEKQFSPFFFEDDDVQH